MDWKRFFELAIEWFLFIWLILFVAMTMWTIMDVRTLIKWKDSLSVHSFVYRRGEATTSDFKDVRRVNVLVTDIEFYPEQQ